MIVLIMQLLITVGAEHVHMQIWKKREHIDWPSDEEKTLPELDALYRVEGSGCNVEVWNTTKNQGTKTFANESVEKVFSRDFGIIRNNAEEIEILKIVLNTTHHLADKFVRNFRHIMYAVKVECIFLIVPNVANLVYMLLESVSPLELNRIIIHNRSDKILKLEPKTFLLQSWRNADALEMRKVDFQKPEHLAGFKNLIFNQKTVNGEKIVSLMNNVGKFDAIENISIKAKPILGPIISKILDYPHGFEKASKVWYIKSKNVGEFKVAVAPHHVEITNVLRSPNDDLLM
ncbi:hypothetical protein B9Z55_027536 [Caenorhabditis nigoni]|nr:hypothetical protein B9Z55_027536 [Caenorhabditis nigoni]